MEEDSLLNRQYYNIQQLIGEQITISQIIDQDSSHKTITFHFVTNQSQKDGILKLYKMGFQIQQTQALQYLNSIMPIRCIFHNDVFTKHITDNELQCECVFPASPKLISKYSQKNIRIVYETPQMFQDVVQPYIESLDPKDLEWVQNIIDKKAEVENVIFRNYHPIEGFVLVKDMKFTNASPLSEFYACAISINPKLKTLRDITAIHLDFLQQIFKTSVNSPYH